MAEPEDSSERADRLLRAFVMREFRGESAGTHLGECDDAAVADFTGTDGSYGCETGCSYLRLTAEITCPHGEVTEFEYGKFGEMDTLIEGLEREAGILRPGTTLTGRGWDSW